MKKNIGLLIIRVGLGIMFIIHGYPKITAGPEVWAKLGGAMGVLGIKIFPVFWGFMAAASEFMGGILLIAGVAFIPACAFMGFTMLVAASMHLAVGDGLGKTSHAIELMIVFIGLMLIGPGDIVITKLLNKNGSGEIDQK
ncbi:MAG: DoxX family protein [Candidatus Omnitrophica bacterium]|nr:DoxX family protein [Candidatus Omnitrophota bacterium]